MSEESLNRCLSTLRTSRMDVMTKLRMEQLLMSLRMPLFVDQDPAPDLEELYRRIREVCNGASADEVKDLVAHIVRMHPQ